MLRVQSPRLFGVPFPSLVLVLAHAYPDHRKVVCTPECFSSRTSGAGKNLTAAYIPVYPSSTKSGKLTNLVAECALACFSSTKRMDKLQ